MPASLWFRALVYRLLGLETPAVKQPQGWQTSALQISSSAPDFCFVMRLPQSRPRSVNFAVFVPNNLLLHGTLMMVFTMVTGPTSTAALPFSTVNGGALLPAVENEIPDMAMIVPTMVPPPAPLIVAALPTCQKTFWA